MDLTLEDTNASAVAKTLTRGRSLAGVQGPTIPTGAHRLGGWGRGWDDR